MPKCFELLPCDWLISNLCYQAIEQVYLIKWLLSVYISGVTVHKIHGLFRCDTVVSRFGTFGMGVIGYVAMLEIFMF